MYQNTLPDCSLSCSVWPVEYLVCLASHGPEFYPSPRLEYKHAMDRNSQKVTSDVLIEMTKDGFFRVFTFPFGYGWVKRWRCWLRFILLCNDLIQDQLNYCLVLPLMKPNYQVFQDQSFLYKNGKNTGWRKMRKDFFNQCCL